MLNQKAFSCTMYSEKKDFFERTKKISDIIHRNNIKTCQSIKDVKPSKPASKKRKINKAATGHKVQDIAQARGYSIKISRYDLTPTSYMYDKDGLMKKPSNSAYAMK